MNRILIYQDAGTKRWSILVVLGTTEIDIPKPTPAAIRDAQKITGNAQAASVTREVALAFVKRHGQGRGLHVGGNYAGMDEGAAQTAFGEMLIRAAMEKSAAPRGGDS